MIQQHISQKELGHRIAELRQLKGLSQEELARQVELSRSSLTQIELGNRKLHVLEFQRIAHVLKFSLDWFLSSDFSLELFSEESEQGTNAQSYRIAKPTLNSKKFANVLLYILERCAGKPNVGETVIHRLLYFSDFNYYELYEEHLTGATYYKLPFGPLPANGQAAIHQMMKHDRSIERLQTDYNGYQQTRYIPLKRVDLSQLKASETEILDRVLEQFSDWSAAAISEYAHGDMPWLVSKEGEAINYELALYREAPYSVRTYEEEQV